MPDFKEAATDLVRVALGSRIQYLILRGTDEFARVEGDIDVLVPRDFANEALSHVADLAVRDGWSIAGLSDIRYLVQVCLVKQWGAAGQFRAVKIDIWDGSSWAALGSDPFGDALFKELESAEESEIVGLTTLLQKLLYAGFLRDRDRSRIFGACDVNRILAFSTRNSIPLRQVDLQAERLSSLAQWRLRAASAGVTPIGLPVWAVKVVWRTLWFRTFSSAFDGCVIVVAGADDQRRAALVDRFRGLLQQSGMPAPVVETGRNDLTARATGPGGADVWEECLRIARIRLLLLRGHTVIVDGALSYSFPHFFAAREWRSRIEVKDTRQLSCPIRVRIPGDAVDSDVDGESSVGRAVDESGDLDFLLDHVSDRLLHTIQGIRDK